MTPTTTVRLGAGGSLTVEVLNAYQAVNANDGDLPRRYKRIPFYLVRVLLAVVAGGLALAYHIQQEVLALNVGAATPLIIRAFAQTPPS